MSGPIKEVAEILSPESLTVEENLPGDGQTYPKDGDICLIQYTASFESNGEQFDSSHDHSQTGEFEFIVGKNEVIRGLNDGIQQMTTGARATITMSSSLAYGYSGVPGLIPANADLVFEVWLIAVNGCKNMV